MTVEDDVQSGRQAHERPAKRRRRRGAIAQVILFTSIWSAVAGLFGLLAALPTMLAVYQQHGWGLADFGHRMTSQLDPDELNAILSTSSGTTLAVAVATAIATALSVWIMRRWFEGPALLDLGLRPGAGWLPDSLVGLLLGPLMFLAILLALAAVGWASVGAGAITPRELLTAFVTFVLVGFSEEVLSRGWVLQVLERGRGTRAAVIGSALVFAILHGFNPDFGLTALLGLFLAGLLLAQAYLVTRQLWLPIALHLSWNFSEGPLFGFPVSGLPANGLLHVTPIGPDVVTGGAFGPEAGLVVAGGIAIASALLYLYGLRRNRRQPAA
jgi:membrane protease YdiL (CAAX protease family)